MSLVDRGLLLNKIFSFFKSLGRPKWKIDKDSYSVMAIGLMLGTTVLAGSLTPLGPGLYAGLRRKSGRLSLYTAAAALDGAATLGDWDASSPTMYWPCS